jgi:hypothetical protein
MDYSFRNRGVLFQLFGRVPRRGVMKSYSQCVEFYRWLYPFSCLHQNLLAHLCLTSPSQLPMFFQPIFYFIGLGKSLCLDRWSAFTTSFKSKKLAFTCPLSGGSMMK